MKQTSAPWVALLLALTLPICCSAQSHAIKTPRGEFVELIADLPAGSGPFPAVVLAPGQGYHMNLPAISQTAKRLVAGGVAVYRFNWAYMASKVKGAGPSDNLTNELEDLSAVIASVRADSRIDPARVSVGGKSLGSVVAWRVLSRDAALRSGLFLTPICSRLPQGATEAVPLVEENYPGIGSEKRPTAFIAGDSDPLCSPSVLYRAAASFRGPVRVAIVGGDHGFGNRSLKAPAAEEFLNRNIETVSAASLSFVVDTIGQ